MLLLEILILCLSFFGAFAEEDECDTVNPYTKCFPHIPRELIDEIDVVPNKEELRSICPGQLEYFKCFTDHLDDCGRMNEHYTVIEFIEKSYEITQNLCNEDSALHHAYVASAECYKSLKGSGDICENEAKDIYDAYYEFLKEQHPERVDAVHKSSQQMCMTQSYKIACLSEKVLKECGDVAGATLMEIVGESQYLRQFCSQSMIDELKTSYLDKVDKEQEELEIYQNAFNLIRK